MSIFYHCQYEQLFPVPLIAFERLYALQDLPPEEALSKVLSECCGKPKPTEAEIQYFLGRLKSDAEEANTRVASITGEANRSPTKTLGTSFQKFLTELDSARLLLWACGYDFDRAKYLYTQVDRSIATQIIDDFLKLQHERNTYQFEAVLYGFGGSYSSDAQDEDTVDMTDLDASSIMAMFK